MALLAHVEPRHLEGLGTRDRFILKHRYHLEGRPLRYRRKLAAELGISRERVRVLEVRALARLRGMIHRERRRARAGELEAKRRAAERAEVIS
jgi:DNA-directed RNA polymerase sigma subunit (sigma70/sigma32)